MGSQSAAQSNIQVQRHITPRPGTYKAFATVGVLPVASKAIREGVVDDTRLEVVACIADAALAATRGRRTVGEDRVVPGTHLHRPPREGQLSTGVASQH